MMTASPSTTTIEKPVQPPHSTRRPIDLIRDEIIRALDQRLTEVSRNGRFHGTIGVEAVFQAGVASLVRVTAVETVKM